jgi:Iap family predicted aminopeptidase
MNIKDIAAKLVALGERQGKTTLRAAKILTDTLRAAETPYSIEKVAASLPRGTATLTIDGKRIPCAATAMKSGVIDSAYPLTSSLIPSRYLIDVANINFNPISDGLSLSNFYFAPSVAIYRKDVPRVMRAKKLRGAVRVRKERINLPQILVGNKKNPRTIIFTHYDSVGGPGAIDNASGTAVCLWLCVNRPNLLAHTLFVFDPNEEISYDYPTYWGHGYRAFEKKYARLLQNAKRVIALDSVGNGAPIIERNPAVVKLALPLANVTSLSADVLTIEGDIPHMMTVYQSEIDTIDLLSEKHLRAAAALAEKLA